MKQGIIFDLDGTLWDSTAQVVPAWNQALKRHPELGLQITDEEMHGFMGKTADTIAGMIFPQMDKQAAIAVLDECCTEELVYLRLHGGILYPRLEETLQSLCKEYSLFIVSNCQDGYVETFLDCHRMNPYFDDIECIGRTGKPKGENIRLVIERNGLEKAIYLGDTQGDLDAADFAGIPFLHAAYGFGTVNRDVPSIGCFSALPDAVASIF